MRGMSTSADDLLESALKLPREERARIAAELIASLDGITAEGVDAAWNVELEGRIDEADRGESQLLDWDAVKGEIAHALLRLPGMRAVLKSNICLTRPPTVMRASRLPDGHVWYHWPGETAGGPSEKSKRKCR